MASEKYQHVEGHFRNRCPSSCTVKKLEFMCTSLILVSEAQSACHALPFERRQQRLSEWDTPWPLLTQVLPFCKAERIKLSHRTPASLIYYVIQQSLLCQLLCFCLRWCYQRLIGTTAKVCSCLQEAGECLMSVKHAVSEEMNFVHSSGRQFCNVT